MLTAGEVAEAVLFVLLALVPLLVVSSDFKLRIADMLELFAWWVVSEMRARAWAQQAGRVERNRVYELYKFGLSPRPVSPRSEPRRTLEEVS